MTTASAYATKISCNSYCLGMDSLEVTGSRPCQCPVENISGYKGGQHKRDDTTVSLGVSVLLSMCLPSGAPTSRQVCQSLNSARNTACDCIVQYKVRGGYVRLNLLLLDYKGMHMSAQRRARTPLFWHTYGRDCIRLL